MGGGGYTQSPGGFGSPSASQGGERKGVRFDLSWPPLISVGFKSAEIVLLCLHHCFVLPSPTILGCKHPVVPKCPNCLEVPIAAKMLSNEPCCVLFLLLLLEDASSTHHPLHSVSDQVCCPVRGRIQSWRGGDCSGR